MSDNLILLCAQELNGSFSREDIQMANRYMKKKMINVFSHQENAYWTHNEILPHICQDSY